MINASHARPLRLGIVGGGPTSWIGGMHRRAAQFDGLWKVVAGVFSSNADRSRDAAAGIGLDPARGYADVASMIAAEKLREDGIDAVAIMSPNDTHYPYCVAALDAGLDVICDKPVSTTAAEARDLAARAQALNRVLCVTHAYSAYPMTRYMKKLIAEDAIGPVRMVQMEYIQSGLAKPIEQGTMTDSQRWKFDADRSGLALSFSAIGCHAQHLACNLVNQKIAAVSADVSSLMPGRTVTDTILANLRFDGGARGQYTITQAAAGGENDIRLRIYGERGMLDWSHRESAYLKLNIEGETAKVIGRGDVNLPPDIARLSRTPRGHPEGLLEAFANVYREAAEAIIARRNDQVIAATSFPTITDAVHTMDFIEACIASHARNGEWTKLAN
jgi:predicted dehydrogenase